MIFFLYFLALFIWIGPLINSLFRNNFSILHPRTLFPIFVVISFTSAVSEKIFGWSGKFDEGFGLRHQMVIEEVSIYHYPLLLLIISGFFYMVGSFIATHKVQNSVTYFNQKQSIAKYQTRWPSKSQLLLYSVLLFFALVTPFFLLGQGQGNFWTTVLFQTVYYIPALVHLHNKKIGKILFICIIPLAFLTDSKASLVVLFLIYLITININNYQLISSLRLKNVIYLILGFFILSNGVLFVANMRGEVGDIGFLLRVFHREYAFEMFALLVSYKREIVLFNPSISWTLIELKEAVPHAIASIIDIEKLRAGWVVLEYTSPEEYEYFLKLPHGHVPSMYRFFLFPLYYDFSEYGIIFGSLFFGLFYGYIYSYVFKLAIKMNSKHILVFLIPFVINSHLIVNGAYGIAIITIFLTISILIFANVLFNYSIVYYDSK
jgi:hypothetical protein